MSDKARFLRLPLMRKQASHSLSVERPPLCANELHCNNLQLLRVESLCVFLSLSHTQTHSHTLVHTPVQRERKETTKLVVAQVSGSVRDPFL